MDAALLPALDDGAKVVEEGLDTLEVAAAAFAGFYIEAAKEHEHVAKFVHAFTGRFAALGFSGDDFTELGDLGFDARSVMVHHFAEGAPEKCQLFQHRLDRQGVFGLGGRRLLQAVEAVVETPPRLFDVPEWSIHGLQQFCHTRGIRWPVAEAGKAQPRQCFTASRVRRWRVCRKYAARRIAVTERALRFFSLGVSGLSVDAGCGVLTLIMSLGSRHRSLGDGVAGLLHTGKFSG